QGKTPYEVWTGKKPRLNHIRVFGSEAYVPIPKQLRKKWDKKSQKLILVGYQSDSCNYSVQPTDEANHSIKGCHNPRDRRPVKRNE
ncbi:Copia protein, partial [Ooceraea biroi]